MPNHSQSLRGVIAVRDRGSDITEVMLADDSLAIGESVMVECRHDVARGVVVARGLVRVPCVLGRDGDYCRVRRPGAGGRVDGPAVASPEVSA